MSDIKLLSPKVVDQIAAGEVVERPAHLVKELVENSIDSGATKIEVEFDFGGKKIKVKDNGSGIVENQLELALSRHATSKISTSEDIWELSSYGFRGEALASISAVCELTLISKTQQQDYACKIKSEFGKLGEIESVGSEQGTTILIDNLFENVPARLKFLKSDTAESTQIKNVLKAMALSHPDVEFNIKHKGEMIFYWPPQEDYQKRSQSILEIDEMYVGHGECNGIQAEVILSSPNKTLKSSKQIWIFVQDRWIQDRGLQAAVMDGYRSLLMHGEYPYASIFVKAPTSDIDVNIHPTKSQVKFRNASDGFRAVARATRSVLEKAPWLDSFLGSQNFTPQAKTTEHSISTEETNISFRDESFNRVQFSQKDAIKSSPSLEDLQQAADLQIEQPRGYGAEDSMQMVPEAYLSSNVVTDTDSKWSRLQVLGQADLTYIITQSNDAMIIVDQHAAHERVLYERISKSYQQGGVEIQSYLVPLTIEMEEDAVELVMLEKDHLNKLGVSVDQMGPTSLAVRAAPVILKESSIVKSLELLAKESSEKGGSFAFEKVMIDIIATMACHSAIRAGQSLSHKEMGSLLESMDEFPLSSFCPHGRPVFVEYKFNKLERDFGRIV